MTASNNNGSTMISGTANTTLFALSSVLKQWEMKIAKKMRMGALSTHKQFKQVALGHMGNLFQIDDTFEKLNGRELYNSIVGALTGAGVFNTSFVKEVYTKKESEKLARRGQDISDIHII
jgi:hypothetical protein